LTETDPSIPWWASPTIRAGIGVGATGLISILHALGVRIPMAEKEAAELLGGVCAVGLAGWMIHKRIKQGKDPAMPGMATITLTKKP
jgi:hypothetical protein